MSEQPMIQLEEKNGHDAPWVPVGEPFPAPAMSATPHLDRAIVAAKNAAWKHFDFDPADLEAGETDRTYACALIASVWEQIAMARKPYSKTKGYEYNAGVAVGFEAALREFRKFSILESEG